LFLNARSKYNRAQPDRQAIIFMLLLGVSACLSGCSQKGIFRLVSTVAEKFGEHFPAAPSADAKQS
jgi:hypothetical protein